MKTMRYTLAARVGSRFQFPGFFAPHHHLHVAIAAAHGVEDALGDLAALVGRTALQQHAELVAAQAGQGVGFAGAGAQSLGHLDEELVAQGVAQAALGGTFGDVPDIVCFGHTHTPLFVRHEGLWLLNPGTLRLDEHPTFARLLLEPGLPPRAEIVHVK